jgi:hypothetical protein
MLSPVDPLLTPVVTYKFDHRQAFGLVTGFIAHLQLVIAINSSAITISHTPLLTVTSTRFCCVFTSLLIALGGLHGKHAVQREIWVPTKQLLWDQGKPRKTLLELAGRMTFRMQTNF